MAMDVVVHYFLCSSCKIVVALCILGKTYTCRSERMRKNCFQSCF